MDSDSSGIVVSPVFYFLKFIHLAVNQNILVTTDCIVFGCESGNKYLLLIKRKNEPYQEKWAFPGGFVEDHEDLDHSAVRELEEETGLMIDRANVKQLGAFGTPGRDPRGRTVTVAFVAIIDKNSQSIKAADDASDVKWWLLNNLPELAFDHSLILDACLERFNDIL